MGDEWRTMSAAHLNSMVQMGALRSNMGIRKPETASINGFDPYETMLNRRQRVVDGDSGDYKEPDVVKYASEDIKALEEFCQQHGIFATWYIWF